MRNTIIIVTLRWGYTYRGGGDNDGKLKKGKFNVPRCPMEMMELGSGWSKVSRCVCGEKVRLAIWLKICV